MGLTAGFLAPQLFSSCKKDSPGPLIKFNGSIAIIGAGAAGLYAADILNAQGLDVFLLEARSELGGRVRSFSAADSQTDNSSSAFIYDYKYPPIADFPVELGGDLVMGSNSIWGQIITTLNLPTVDLSSAVNQYILDNSPKAASAWQSDADFNAVESFVSGLSTYAGADVSIQSAAGVSARAQALLNSQGGNFYGSSSNRIGALPLAADLKLRTHDSKLLLVKSNQWQDILLSRFNAIVSKIQLNTAVTSIDYSSADSIVITDRPGNQYKANKVIITVPVSILQSNGILFNPALPSINTAAAAKFGMDPCMRLVIDFKTNFWGENDGFIWGTSIAPQYFNSGFNRSKFTSTLVVTVCGQAAATLSSFSGGGAPQILKPVLAELDGLYPDPSGKFPGLASRYVIRKIVNNAETDPVATIYDWSQDPFIKGGFSYPLPGTSHQDRINLGTPVNNQLFLAGEATDVNGDAGTVSGALLSAERATTELIKSITG